MRCYKQLICAYLTASSYIFLLDTLSLSLPITSDTLHPRFLGNKWQLPFPLVLYLQYMMQFFLFPHFLFAFHRRNLNFPKGLYQNSMNGTWATEGLKKYSKDEKVNELPCVEYYQTLKVIFKAFTYFKILEKQNNGEINLFL